MNQNIVYLLFLLFAITACKQEKSYSPWLIQADSQMKTNPEEALSLLQDSARSSLQTSADQAYYALLLTQARDKNYIVQTNDSLIQKAVHYYDTHEDAAMQARAYYLWGSFYRDQNDYSQAIDKYTIALSHVSDRSECAELKASLYSNLGYLYYTQGLNSEADSIYHRAALLAKSQKDTISICYSLLQRGMISLDQGKKHYPKAERQMQQALSIGKAFSDSTILVPVYHSLSVLYNQMPKPRQALQYARLNYSVLKDTLHCYRTFLLLGNAYFLNGQYDAADIFLKKVFKAERYYDTKADACMRLSEIAQKKGDMETSILMERKRAMYQDSARVKQQKHHILKGIIARERSNSNAISKRSTHILYTTVAVFFFISLICLFYFWKKYLQYKAPKQELVKKEWENAISQERVSRSTLKQAYTKEEYKTSTLYLKVSRIAKELPSVETKENLTEEEWSRFVTLTNVGWNGIIAFLDEKYNLSAEEIRICCLYLAKVPVTHMGHFLHIQSRSTVQSKSKDILLKIEAPEGALLKNMLFSLAEQLKNCN